MKRKSMALRNPFVAAARFKKAGAHGKTHQAMRRAERMELQREYGVTAAQHPFKVPGLGSSPSAPTSGTTQTDPKRSSSVVPFPGSQVGKAAHC